MFVCVCVCEVDRETDCFLLFVLVCFDSELVEIYVGLVCVFGGSCMYSLPPSPPGRTPSYVSVPVLYLYKYRLGGAFY